MKKYFYVLLFFIACFNRVNAQIDTFDIGQFILPEVSLKSLNFSGTFSGDVRNQSTLINTGDNIRQNINVILAYNNFESDYHHQKVTFGNLFLSGAYQNAATDFFTGQAVQDQISNVISLFYDRINRNYYEPERFYGLEASVFLNNNFESYEANGNIRYYENRLQTNVGIPFIYGFGRIEPVTDAWHAVRILEDFERFGLLDQTPDSEAIFDLAQKLSDLRYERIFESRFGRIRRIKSLDDYIQKAGLVNDHGSSYFTSLYDIYEFGLQTTRSSGERLTFGIGPQFSIQQFANDSTSTFNIDYGGFVFGNYVFNYPINQEWQLDIEAAVSATYLLDSDQILSNNFSALPELTIKTGFYPNTRTFFTSAVSTGILYASNLELSNKFAFYFSLAGNAYYFFSPRTALSINVGFNYSQSAFVSSLTPFLQSEGYRFNYAVQLNHALY
ncbi:MAG: hypothetical protein DWQ02_26610 [Bacteroidetes bacterium]|nr:MAG: hypothetical protein DWQ02_26610 [Bacteroidota bacterium]